MWYRRVIGSERCPIVDTWWQTETGAIMVTPLPGATPTKPGSCTRPLPGDRRRRRRRERARACAANGGGYLVIARPWPSMLRTVWGDDERYVKTYSEPRRPAVYFAGDGARRDEDGYFWVMGRIDDVLNVAGHRLGTMEIESALVAHPDVAEAAVVGRPDDLKGQALVAFVTLKTGSHGVAASEGGAARARGARRSAPWRAPTRSASPRRCPRRASGKIMRRLLKEIAAGGDVKGDITTLEDMAVLNRLSTSDEE